MNLLDSGNENETNMIELIISFGTSHGIHAENALVIFMRCEINILISIS
jgi:hypothetical protein